MATTKKITRHLVSVASALWVTINLGLWLFPIVLLALFRLLLPFKAPRKLITLLTEGCYRGAVWGNNFWMFHVVGIDLRVEGALPDHEAPVIVSNHQTWMDIPVLHGAISRNGPILKFLIKRELLWVPIIGWICYALNFPRLNRGQGEDAREKDYAAIQSFSRSLTSERGALLIYAEGTRFTEEKKLRQASPYPHLLNPRPGGLKIALENAPPDTPVVDVTIVYDGDTNFWRCLGGNTRKIKVVIRNYDAAEITDVRSWLGERWAEKENFFHKGSTTSA